MSQHTKRRHRLFALNAIVSLVLASIALLWAGIDASYNEACWLAAARLKLTDALATGTAATSMMQWGMLGRRVAFVYCVYGLGFMATVVMSIVVSRHFSLSRLLICIAIIMFWFLPILARKQIAKWRTIYQVKSALHEFEQDA
ncbi:hypothetical protein AB1L42_23835, partial [Thalassoglobus sp. JC818]|uniref:hypothetical protein n=1 Tax=Thalassoglobus sp. JC818 TaxID=3232136 RepID=UPI00345845BF